MAHKDWCGKPCGECENHCPLDHSMPCSPDCEEMNADGTRNAEKCVESGCDAFGSTPGVCPVCNSGDIEYGSSYVEDQMYIYEWSCEECGADGRELYELDFVCTRIN